MPSQRTHPTLSRQRFLGTGLAAGVGILSGMLISASLAVGNSQVGQDPALVSLQQQLNNLRLANDNLHQQLRARLDTHDRDLLDFRYRLGELERSDARRRYAPRAEQPGVSSLGPIAVKEVRTESLALHDFEGNVLATLVVRDGSPALVLLDETGREMAVLRSGPDGAKLRLRDADGNWREIR